MNKRTISVNIGSNIGNRKANLLSAVEAISRKTGCALRVSDIFESESWGYHSDNPFYNIEAEFESALGADDLLAIFREIEVAAGSTTHRDKRGGYIDRILDIDIIYIGNEVIDTPTLKIPHPHMQEREFVLRPLSQLSPSWLHPTLHLTALQLLHNLELMQK